MIFMGKLKIILFVALSLVIFLLGAFSQICFSANNQVKIYFFYSSDCKECLDIKNNYLPRVIREYSSLVEIKYFEINNPDNYRLMTELEEKYGMIKNPPPTIFVEDKLLDGEEEIWENLEEVIKLYLGTNGGKWPEEKDSVDKSRKEIGLDKIVEKFKYLGVITVVGAGLIDGINPCAFATIIIFVLYLTFTGYKRREILKVGIIFALAIFTAYFLIGVGLLEFVQRVKFLPTLSQVITLLLGIGAIILGFLSLYDFYKIKKGKLKEITLQLPDKIKERIKRAIWKKSSRKHYLASAFIIGFLVGILEFPCTGQIYFPIVLVLREMPSLRIHALSYLVLYNLMFIIPLLVVFTFVFLGTTSDKLIGLLEKHSGVVKILTAILFFTLGALLILFKFG